MTENSMTISSLPTAETHTTMKEYLEEVADRALSAGLYWPEVAGEFEKLFIIAALRRARGCVQEAAELMGIHRNTLSKKIREHGIDRSELKS